MNTIEALQGAVEMLQKIAKGGSYNLGEYFDRLMAYEAALAKVQRNHLEDERKRAAEVCGAVDADREPPSYDDDIR